MGKIIGNVIEDDRIEKYGDDLVHSHHLITRKIAQGRLKHEISISSLQRSRNNNLVLL